jgi:ActR/RegA family two-component response regulator
MVLVFEPDLMFSSRMESAAIKAGLEVKVALTIPELERFSQQIVPKALLVNLDALENSGLSWVESVRGRCRLIGYYSHVDSALGTWALANGFDQVMPRRAFVEKLIEILSGLSSS